LHGTNSKNIESIIKNGFLLSYIGNNTKDPGYFGKGLYFTQMANYGEFYIDSRIQREETSNLSLLLCWVLLGNPYPVTNMDFYGKGLMKGFTSHYTWVGSNFLPTEQFQSPYGDEIVIFNESAVYPFAVIEYDKI